MASSLYTLLLPTKLPVQRELIMPSKTPFAARFCALDCTAWLKLAGTTILRQAVICDAPLRISDVSSDGKIIFFAVRGGDVDTMPAIGISFETANHGREDVAIVQPIKALSPPIAVLPEDGGLVSNGQVITEGLPVDLAQMGPPPGGSVGSDRTLVYRPGVGAFLTPVNVVNGGGGEFRFDQQLPSDTWVITHNLGTHPDPRVVTSAGDQVEASVHYNSDVQLTLTFSNPFSGTAYL